MLWIDLLRSLMNWSAMPSPTDAPTSPMAPWKSNAVIVFGLLSLELLTVAGDLIWIVRCHDQKGPRVRVSQGGWQSSLTYLSQLPKIRARTL